MAIILDAEPALGICTSDSAAQWPPLDLEERNCKGRTALLQSLVDTYDGNLSVYELLLTKGANVKARDFQGDTCLHLLLRNANNPENTIIFEILVSLINAGADVYAVNLKG